MKIGRSSPILILGFGLFIGLTALAGGGALRRAKETYGQVSALSVQYRRTDEILRRIETGIYRVGLLSRDYLLDPSETDRSEYRKRVLTQRSSTENEFDELHHLLRVEYRPALEQLRQEVTAYWNALEPIFAWSPGQSAAQNWNILRTQVRARRRAALAMTEEIDKLTDANLDRQRQEIDGRQSSVTGFFGRMLSVTLALGGLIAGVTVLRMSRLESRSESQRLRAEAAEQELRRLSRQLVQAQEEERKSISRELHDEVGQMLTALRFELRNLRDLRTAPEPEFTEHLRAAKDLADHSLRSLKDLAMGLRPSMLDDLGLGSAVQWQARQFSKRTGIPVNVEIGGLPPWLPERHRTCVYRLIQEALNNCEKHAKAKSIQVAIGSENGEMVVTVTDDGVGFETETARRQGLGLLGIEERVIELGGVLSVLSRPNQGAALKARIPVGETGNGDSHPAGG